MKKHELIHTKRTKTCNFFLSKTPCPFNDIGCKFGHENEANKDTIENAEDVEDEYSLDMNECHLCHLKLSSRDDLWEHVENQHVEYFQGMIDYAADSHVDEYDLKLSCLIGPWFGRTSLCFMLDFVLVLTNIAGVTRK